ncbi:anthranilate synthase component I family protein [Nesterenkonia sphaerica]|nr:anthranilate synthase component I family protein [Nesterenkonia sphaerica]
MSSSVCWPTVPFPAAEDAAAELFGALWQREGAQVSAAFLDSSDHARTPAPNRSRYSILAFSSPADQSADLDSGGFKWLEQNWPHQGARADATGSPSPFQLGWVGWIGYEGQARLFAVTRAVVVDHHLGTAEIQSAGADPDWQDAVRRAVTALPHSRGAPEQVQLRNLRVRDSREAYVAKIGAAQAEIREGNSYEVCLTTAVEGQLQGSAWEAYRTLRQRNRAPFTQFLHFPALPGRKATAVLSTSPERFASITAAGRIRSEPIKGTRPRGATPEEDDKALRDLQSHPKDRAENVMIADLVRNDLSVHAVPGTLRTERLCAVESYPTVHQMVSTISATLDPQVKRARALADAFPPGSMTGAPKASTINILAELESAPRGAYSGVAGWFSATGACDLSVLIRTAVLTSDSVGLEKDQWGFHLGLGGAITADSQPAAEWEEIITKSRGVLGALGEEFPQARASRYSATHTRIADC